MKSRPNINVKRRPWRPLRYFPPFLAILLVSKTFVDRHIAIDAMFRHATIVLKATHFYEELDYFFDQRQRLLITRIELDWNFEFAPAIGEYCPTPFAKILNCFPNVQNILVDPCELHYFDFRTYSGGDTQVWKDFYTWKNFFLRTGTGAAIDFHQKSTCSIHSTDSELDPMPDSRQVADFITALIDDSATWNLPAPKFVRLGTSGCYRRSRRGRIVLCQRSNHDTRSTNPTCSLIIFLHEAHMAGAHVRCRSYLDLRTTCWSECAFRFDDVFFDSKDLSLEILLGEHVIRLPPDIAQEYRECWSDAVSEIATKR